MSSEDTPLLERIRDNVRRMTAGHLHILKYNLPSKL